MIAAGERMRGPLEHLVILFHWVFLRREYAARVCRPHPQSSSNWAPGKFCYARIAPHTR